MEKIEPYKGIADIYEEIRPSYPEQLIQDVISKSDLKTNSRLLEIGAGTGKATIQFARKGYNVHAIEIGRDMAEILEDKCANYPNVTLDVVPFEEWNYPNDQKFEMIYSAQAFHWLDQNIKYKKCHELLKDNGYLVLFWYAPYDNKSSVEVENKVNVILEKYISNYFIAKGTHERRAHYGVSSNDERQTELELSGLFDLAGKVEYTQEVRNNPSQYVLAKKSIPEIASILDGIDNKIIEMMDYEIEEVINSFGGYVNGQFKFTLYIAKKK